MIPSCSYYSKKLRRIFRGSGKQSPNHFLSGRVPDGKYFSGCKCGIFLLWQKNYARSRLPYLAEKPEGDFRHAEQGGMIPSCCIYAFFLVTM